MGVYSVTEVNFLRLLKSCERVLLKGDGDLPAQELHRYQQYVRTLHTYAEELQKRGADAVAADGDGDGEGDGAPCALPPEVMEQHQQKLELIEAALKRSLEAVQGADGAGQEGRTDRAALTTVSRKSTVRKDNAPAPPRINSSSGSGGGASGSGSGGGGGGGGASGSGTAQSTPTRMRHRRANARAATAAAAPEPAAEMDAQDELQDQLAGELLDMTRQFKQQQIELRRQATEDGKVLGQTDELISSNAEKMEMRVGAVAKLQGAIGGWETCKIILGLVRTPPTKTRLSVQAVQANPPRALPLIRRCAGAVHGGLYVHVPLHACVAISLQWLGVSVSLLWRCDSERASCVLWQAWSASVADFLGVN